MSFFRGIFYSAAVGGVLIGCGVLSAAVVPPSPGAEAASFDPAVAARCRVLAESDDLPGLTALRDEYAAQGGGGILGEMISAAVELRSGMPFAAVERLETIAERPLGDSPSERGLRECLLLELARGYFAVKNYPMAGRTFERLAGETGDEVLKTGCRRGVVHAAILGGDFLKAGDLLEGSDPVEGADELRCLLLMRSGRMDEFASAYAELPEAGEVSPALVSLRREIALAGGEYFRNAGSPEQAAAFLRDAFTLSEDEESRMAIGREIIDIQAAAGMDEEALKSSERYLKLFPDDPARSQVMLNQARLSVRAGRRDDAVHIYSAVSGQKSFAAADRRAALTELALLLEQMDRRADAVSCCYALAEASEEEEERQQAAILAAEIHQRGGNFEAAGEFFRKAADLKGGRTAEALCGAARAAVKTARWQEALELSDRILNSDAAAAVRAEAAYRKGEALLGMGRDREALEIFSAAAADFSDSVFGADASGRAGELNMKFGNPQAAYNNFDFAAGLAALAAGGARESVVEGMRINAIRAAGRTGDVRAIAAQIGKLRQEVPDSEELLNAIIWYADFLKNTGRADEARKEFLSWHEYFSDDPEKMARLLMEQALAGDGSPAGDAAAIEALEAAMRLTADDAVTAQLLFERAEVLNRSGDYSGAREACLQGLDVQERSPEKTDPLLNAMLIMRLGDNSFQMFQRMRDPAILNESIEAYRTVVDAAVLPLEFRRQAACRLGRGLESADNPGRALRVYEDTVMDALTEYTARGRVTGADWVGLCGNNAVKICLTQTSSVIGMRALKIIGAMKEMHLAFDRDWDELASEVRKKFSL